MQQLIQEPVMPDRIKSFFEIYKTSIGLFVVIINILIYQDIKVRRVKTCSAVRLFGKKPIWDLWSIFKERIYSKSRWFKISKNSFPRQLETQNAVLGLGLGLVSTLTLTLTAFFKKKDRLRPQPRPCVLLTPPIQCIRFGSWKVRRLNRSLRVLQKLENSLQLNTTEVHLGKLQCISLKIQKLTRTKIWNW